MDLEIGFRSEEVCAITDSHLLTDDRDAAVLSELLVRTSRTFALAIPCLPYPVRRQVTVAYLLFRIADTIEDGVFLDRTEKLAALDSFDRLLCAAADMHPKDVRLDLPRPPSDNPDYLTLLDELPLVTNSVMAFGPEIRDAILRGTRTSIAGMQRFIAAGTAEGAIRIRSLGDLRDYCYVVAGVVGEMLTELFAHEASWLSEVRGELDATARWFGEGLQLVNILKDSKEDEGDGRLFVPNEVTRLQLFELAREDLQNADLYLRALQCAEAPVGFVAFTRLPLRLAWRTLECVEQFGPGSKVPRNEVMSILAQTFAGDSPAHPARDLSEVATK